MDNDDEDDDDRFDRDQQFSQESYDDSFSQSRQEMSEEKRAKLREIEVRFPCFNSTPLKSLSTRIQI